MKRVTIYSFVTILFSILPGMLMAQVPNAGFETWTSGEPDGWWTGYSNMLGTASVTKSSDAHSGSGALRGEVISVSGSVISPTVIAGNFMGGFAYASRSGSLTGYYKFVPSGSAADEFQVDVIMYKGSWISGAIGAGDFSTTSSAASYTKFTIPIEYINEQTPDSAYILVTVSGPGGSDPQVGTYYILDDVAFGEATGVADRPGNTPAVFKLNQNYPNPFNPTTHVSFTVPSSGTAMLKVYNIMGQEIATLFNRAVSGGNLYDAEFNGRGLSSGIYLARLQFTSTTGKVMQSVTKMVLAK
jgi:hypothetical protein